MDNVREGRIIAAWSLLDFCREKGSKMSIGPNKDKDGNEFMSIEFNNGVKRTFVDFGEKLKDGLTKDEILSNFDQLQVVELQTLPEVLEKRMKLKAEGKNVQLETYKLCPVHQREGWETIDVFAQLGIS